MNLFSKGTVLAGAAWALLACGGGSSTSGSTTPANAQPGASEATPGQSSEAMPAEGQAAPATAEQVRCAGVNECKGKSSCAGTGHSCKGMNECKGKGWVMAAADDCSAKGGSVVQ